MTSDLERLCERRGLRADFVFGKARREGFNGAAHNWRVTLRYRGRQLTTDFFGGELVTNPSAADVVSSLVLDANLGEQSFEDFCADLGYDEDSRRAHAIWKTCTREAPRIRRLLGSDFDEFAEAEY